MDHDELHEHLSAACRGGDPMAPRLISRVVGACWPGGTADRTSLVARDWVRRWRPATAAAPLRSCSCATGACALCN